jgi:hypothetical protein
MKSKRGLLPILVIFFVLCACDYIVFPEEDGLEGVKESKGWSAVATHVGTNDAGDLHIDLAIKNETADWSAMQAVTGKPAVFTGGSGKSTNCTTVFVGTGGHRLAPDFQMRGYIAGKKAEPLTQLIYVECAGVEMEAGSRLAISYIYVTGEYNYYYPETNKVDAAMEINLDEIVQDIQYPAADAAAEMIQVPGSEITGLNNVILTLEGIERTENGLQFAWQTNNPGEYPTYVHIGIPPVICSDGILYGFYESPDLASVPITPAGEVAEWTTEAAVPESASGCYIMLSVESKKQRLFVNYAVGLDGQ